MRRVWVPALLACLFAAAVANVAETASREVPTKEGLNTTPKDWFDGSDCAKGEATRFYFRVGQQVFAMPVDRVLRGMPKPLNVRGSFKTGKEVMLLPRTAGCKSNPADFAIVEIQGDQTTAKSILLRAMQSPDGETGFTRYYKRFANVGACKTAKQPNLLVCVGSRGSGAQKIELVFLVVTNASGQVDHGPMHDPAYAECAQAGANIHCVLVAEWANGVQVRANITSSPMAQMQIPNASQIAKARAATDAFLEKIKLRSGR